MTDGSGTGTGGVGDVRNGIEKVFSGDAGEIRVLRGIVRALRKRLDWGTEDLLKLASEIVEEIDNVGREAQRQEDHMKGGSDVPL